MNSSVPTSETTQPRKPAKLQIESILHTTTDISENDEADLVWDCCADVLVAQKDEAATSLEQDKTLRWGNRSGLDILHKRDTADARIDRLEAESKKVNDTLSRVQDTLSEVQSTVGILKETSFKA